MGNAHQLVHVVKAQQPAALAEIPAILASAVTPHKRRTIRTVHGVDLLNGDYRSLTDDRPFTDLT